MEEALAGLLLADTEVSAVIGDRLTWSTRQQKALTPSLVLTRVSGTPVYSDEGEAGIVESRVQVDCWATTFAAAKRLARAVKNRVSGMNETSGGIEFSGVFIDTEDDSFEIGAADERLYRTRLDLMVWHSQETT